MKGDTKLTATMLIYSKTVNWGIEVGLISRPKVPKGAYEFSARDSGFHQPKTIHYILDYCQLLSRAIYRMYSSAISI